MKHLPRSIATAVTLLAGVVGSALLLVGAPGSDLKLLTVQTGSMAPEIPSGSVVLVQRVPESALRPGDVLTYINPDNVRQTITHRLIGETRESGRTLLQLKGDANASADRPVAASSVVGKVTWSAPLLGSAINFLRTPLGLASAIYLPALLVVLYEIRLLARKIESWETAGQQRLRIGSATKPATWQALAVLAAVPALVFTGSTSAMLSSEASLRGTTITTAAATVPTGPAAPPRLLITEVWLSRPERAPSAATGAAVTWRVTLRNTDKMTVSTKGWRMASSTGSVALPATHLLPGSSRSFKPLFTKPLLYAGERITLLAPTGAPGDALSWGTDSSRLSPAIAGLPAHALELQRTSPGLDTDTAADWRLVLE